MRRADREAVLGAVRERFGRLTPFLSEQTRRFWAAAESLAIGRGGPSIVAAATGFARATILRGQHDLNHPETLALPKQRRPGGGRKRLGDTDPTLLRDLDRLIDPHTRGDPESPLRWTCKSTYQLAEALQQRGHRVSQRTVYALLDDLDYSLQANRKTEEGADHADRDAQFHYIYRQVRRAQADGQPVISVDAKKKEPVGNYGNSGEEWEPRGQPRRVRTHDFPDDEQGSACLYGIYDLTRNAGWVNVGISHNTAQFAVARIRSWWRKLGQARYPRARKLLLTADAGGSNGYRTRLWKRSLQELADEFGLPVQVCHFPPGTSKWNKIEHRLFSFISKNWRGRPLDSLAVIVNLIAHTTTKTGLQVEASLDYGTYETGIEVSDEEMMSLKIKAEKFHGDWNYVILPR
jgi:Rhodopirellula transposase DDE domain